MGKKPNGSQKKEKKKKTKIEQNEKKKLVELNVYIASCNITY